MIDENPLMRGDRIRHISGKEGRFMGMATGPDTPSEEFYNDGKIIGVRVLKKPQIIFDGDNSPTRCEPDEIEKI